MEKKTVKLHEAQAQIAKDTHRFRVINAGRRFGKTFLISYEMFSMAVANDNARVPYYAPTRDDARDILWKQLKEICAPLTVGEPNETKLEIVVRNRFNTTSLIVLYGWEAVQERGKGVGVKNNHIYFDEVAKFKNFLYGWQEILRPTLIDLKGGATFVSCVVKNTMILGEQGMEEIGVCKDGYSKENKLLFGLGGFHKTKQRYGSGLCPTKKILTKFGFEIECTPNHKLWTLDGWKRSDEFKKGDQLLLQYGQGVFGRGFNTKEFVYSLRKPVIDFDTTLDNDLCYLLGLILAEGNWSKHNVDITSGDEEIGEFIKKYGFNLQSRDKFHYRLSSAKACEFLDWIGIPHGAKNKIIPPKIFSLPKEMLASFLSGYFDGDGFADTVRPRIGCTSSSEKLSRQIQILLLNFGILTKFRAVETPPNPPRVNVSSMGYRLVAENYAASVFFREIGFRLTRKQQYKFNSENTYKTSFNRKDFGRLNAKYGYLTRENKVEIKTLAGLLKHFPNEKYNLDMLCDEVKEITDGKNNVYDFVIPETHSYFTNGFISHNTPNGFNHFYDLSLMENEDQDFKYFHFTSMDNPHLPPEELEKMRNEMTSDRFAQEVMGEFRKKEGLVYKEFNREKHIFHEMPAIFLEKIAGVDWGHNHPAVILTIKKDYDGIYWITNEWYKPEKTESEVVDIVASMNFNKVYADSENASGCQALKNKGVNVRETIKGHDSVLSGISKVQEMLKQGRIKVHHSCTNTIQEFESYSYPDGKGKIPSENPMKENDDAMDALRYAIFSDNGVSNSNAPKMSYGLNTTFGNRNRINFNQFKN